MDYMSFTQLVYASCHSQESLVYLSGIPTVTLVAIDWTRRTFANSWFYVGGAFRLGYQRDQSFLWIRYCLLPLSILAHMITT